MKKDSIIVEVKPFLDGGQIRVTHNSITTARHMPRYEYEYVVEDLKRLAITHLDISKETVWKE